MNNINNMSKRELMAFAAELGAHSEESLEDSATRFEHHDEVKAELFHAMAFRWWVLDSTEFLRHFLNI